MVENLKGIFCPHCGTQVDGEEPNPDDAQEQMWHCPKCDKWFHWIIHNPEESELAVSAQNGIDRWWDKLSPEVENTRIKLNMAYTKEVVKALKRIIATLILGITAIMLSLLQPIYVADKLGTVWFACLLFQLGILIGLLLIERHNDKIFRRIAKNR